MNSDIKFRTHCFSAMGGLCTLKLYHEDFSTLLRAFKISESETIRLEKKYSRFLMNSEISKINAGAGSGFYNIDSETAGLLNYASTCFEISDGLFDVTSGVLRAVWDFNSHKLPHEKELKSCLSHVGFQKLYWDGEDLYLPKNMELDFGGIVKEYAVDRVKTLLVNLGIDYGSIDFSGDVSVINNIVHQEPILVGVRNPQMMDQPLVTIPLSNKSIATSGSYERYMELGGIKYCHILNPYTGWPVQYTTTVSVVSDSCLVSGSLSTTAMLKEHDGPAWLESQGAIFYMKSEIGEQFGSLSCPASAGL
mgnify:CR=1 FL=1